MQMYRMKNYHLFAIAVICITFIGLDMQAQTNSWTLERCFRYAKDHNIQLKQSKLNSEFAEIDLKQSKDDRYPSLNGSTGGQYNFGRFINPTTNEFITRATPTVFLSLNSRVDLFRGFTIQNTIERNEMALESTKIQNRVQENNLGLNIVSAYLSLLQAQEQLKVLQEQILLSEEQKQRTEKLIRAGVLPKGDILNIEAQIANEQLAIVNAENSIELARLNLMQILDYYEQPIEVVVPEMEPPSANELDKMDVYSIYTKALSELPEVQAAQLDERIAEKNVEIAEGGKWPSVSLSAGASTNFAGIKQPTDFRVDSFVQMPIGYLPSPNGELPVFFDEPAVTITEEKVTPFGEQFTNNFGYNFGLGVSVPIFNNYRVKNNITRSQLAVKNAQLSRELTQNGLLQTIQQAYQAARSAAKNYETTLKNIESLQQSLNNVERRYELGLATALEYSTARNALSVAKLNLNSAKYEYVFRLKILDFYQGKPLKF